MRDAIFQALIRIDADAAIEGCRTLARKRRSSDSQPGRGGAAPQGARSIPFLKTIMDEGDKDMRKLVLDVLSGVHAGNAEAIYAGRAGRPGPECRDHGGGESGQDAGGGFPKPRSRTLLEGDCHPMLVGACLEALVGIGDESSLGAIRPRFPDLTALPDFLLVSCLKAHWRSRIGRGVRRGCGAARQCAALTFARRFWMR